MDKNLFLPQYAEPAPLIQVADEIEPGFELTPDGGLQCAVRGILLQIGEQPERDGLLKTPQRVARMYGELTAGYNTDPQQLINGAIFEVDYRDLVLVKDIEFFSLCEHHLLPFFGRAHVAYLPHDRVIGLSKIPRIVEMFARRLQVQERMTSQIANFVQEVLQPAGVAVLVEGSHLCAMMRGVKKPQASMTTRAMLGAFDTDRQLRSEFLALVSKSRAED